MLLPVTPMVMGIASPAGIMNMVTAPPSTFTSRNALWISLGTLFLSDHATSTRIHVRSSTFVTTPTVKAFGSLITLRLAS
jgi:hypothetical protein